MSVGAIHAQLHALEGATHQVPDLSSTSSGNPATPANSGNPASTSSNPAIDPRVIATAQQLSAAQAAADAPRRDGASGTDSTEATIVVADEEKMLGLLGFRDASLRQLEESLAADIHVRGNRITLRGPASDVAFAEKVLRELLNLQATGSPISPEAIRHSIGMLAGGAHTPAEVLGLNIVSRRGRTIRPKTLNQKRYVDAIDANTITFGIGPAGTGKTYLAMAKAVQALQAKQVNRIILTRPAVEAGERLGYLPGTLNDKIDPYLRPLYDALHDMIDPESVPRLTQAGTIEVAPLAYMRGRTLNDAFIILDEAQNTTPEQMKMFLTRLGFGSKIVVTGDVTQIDLPGGQKSGLQVVREILAGLDDVHFAYLTSTDVVRHRLVGAIVDAYETWDAGNGEADEPRPARTQRYGDNRRPLPRPEHRGERPEHRSRPPAPRRPDTGELA